MEVKFIKKTGFITVSEADFVTICNMLDTEKEKPDSGKLKNPAYSSYRLDGLLYDCEIGSELSELVDQQDPDALKFDGET